MEYLYFRNHWLFYVPSNLIINIGEETKQSKLIKNLSKNFSRCYLIRQLNVLGKEGIIIKEHTKGKKTLHLSEKGLELQQKLVNIYKILNTEVHPH